MTNTLKEQIAHWNELEELNEHSDTMRALSPLERELLKDYRTHLINYDEHGNWVGPVRNENGWTP